MSQNVPGLLQGEPAIEPFFTATQEMLSGDASANFQLIRLSNTQVQIPAGAGDAQVSASIMSRYRFITAALSRTIVGAAATYDLFITAADNDFTGTPPDIDNTNYAFDLVSVAHNTTPAAVALYRKVGEVDWNGSKILSVRPLLGFGLQHYEFGHSWAVGGSILVPVGTTDSIPGIFVPVHGFRTVRFKRVRGVLESAGGNTANVEVRVMRAGVQVDLLGNNCGNVASETAADPPITLQHNDMLKPVVIAIGGSPVNLSLTAIVEHY